MNILKVLLANYKDERLQLRDEVHSHTWIYDPETMWGSGRGFRVWRCVKCNAGFHVGLSNVPKRKILMVLSSGECSERLMDEAIG